uniref:U-box domain-containing protein n=1 Tax=Eutreptiella gymnastica TaxID=73025 RepID=A0A7S1I5F1_9EUGL
MCAKEVTAQKGILTGALQRMNKNWEQILTDKEQGRDLYGTSLGRIHEYMVVLLSRVCDYKFTTLQLIEFSSERLSFALFLLSTVMKVVGYEREFRMNCITILKGFSSPITYFTDGAVQHQEFADRINSLLSQVQRLNLLQVACDAVAPLVTSSPMFLDATTHIAAQQFMNFAIDVYRFATIGATGFRQTLLVNTAIVDRVVLPYLLRCMAVVAKHFQMQTAYDTDPKPIPKMTKEVCVGMRTALDFLALASFHMGSHSQALLPQNVFTLDILQLPVNEFLCQQPEILSRLLHVNVNLDSLAGEHGLPPAIVSRMTPGCQASNIMMHLAQLLAVLPMETLVQVYAGVIESRAIPIAKDSTSFDILENLIVQTTEAKQRGTDCGADTIPVLSSTDLDKLTADLDKQFEQLTMAKEEVQFIKQALNGDLGSSDIQSRPSTASQACSTRLLGALPSLNMTRAAATPERPTTAEARSADIFTSQTVKLSMPRSIVAPMKGPTGCPKDFKCAINGHVMKNPVDSPTGHTFERETIEYWLHQNGSVCPITGKPLTKEELVLNTKLQHKISSWLIKEALSSSVQDEQDDLYAF